MMRVSEFSARGFCQVALRRRRPSVWCRALNEKHDPDDTRTYSSNSGRTTLTAPKTPSLKRRRDEKGLWSSTRAPVFRGNRLFLTCARVSLCECVFVCGTEFSLFAENFPNFSSSVAAHRRLQFFVSFSHSFSGSLWCHQLFASDRR